MVLKRVQFFLGDEAMESSAITRAVCLSPFVRQRLELDRLRRGTTRRDRWRADLEESVWKTGKHTEISPFWQGMRHRKTDLHNTRSTSGIKLQRRWQSFRDAHPLFSEETSTGTPCRTTRRSGGSIHARISRTVERTSARFAKQRSFGLRRPGLRDRCHRTLAGRETLARIYWRTSRPDHILLSVDLASPPGTVDFLSSRNLRGTALASIDHAPLRITLRYRFRAFGQRGGRRRFDRARLAAATTDLHFAKQFVGEVQRWAQAHLDKLEQ